MQKSKINFSFAWLLQLLESYESDDRTQYLLDNYEVHFVPVGNPDGYIYSWDYVSW